MGLPSNVRATTIPAVLLWDPCFWDQYLWAVEKNSTSKIPSSCLRPIIESSHELIHKLHLHQKLNNWANLCWGINRIFSLFSPTAVVGFLREKGRLLPSPDPTDPTKTDEIAFNEGSDCICWFYCTYRGNYCCQRTLDVTEILSGGKPGSESCWDSSRIFTGGGAIIWNGNPLIV